MFTVRNSEHSELGVRYHILDVHVHVCLLRRRDSRERDMPSGRSGGFKSWEEMVGPWTRKGLAYRDQRIRVLVRGSRSRIESIWFMVHTCSSNRIVAWFDMPTMLRLESPSMGSDKYVQEMEV